MSCRLKSILSLIPAGNGGARRINSSPNFSSLKPLLGESAAAFYQPLQAALYPGEE